MLLLLSLDLSLPLKSNLVTLISLDMFLNQLTNFIKIINNPNLKARANLNQNQDLNQDLDPNHLMVILLIATMMALKFKHSPIPWTTQPT